MGLGFNTASVLIQRGLFRTSKSGKTFQYSFCSYSTWLFRWFCSSNHVSIQLLFLFNFCFQAFYFPVTLFQYSFCSYSTIVLSQKRRLRINVSIQLLFLFNRKMNMFGRKSIKFQYSFCSYSTDWFHLPIDYMGLFQYSFCSYSTIISESSCLSSSGFNTASVLIQRKKRDFEVENLVFQYSFCSYSTIEIENLLKQILSFNTASVLIQPSNRY